MPPPGAPHLDPAIAGLAAVPPRRRRLFGRSVDELDSVPSAAELAVLQHSLATPVPSPRRIGVVALKGGVGKTTLAVLLAATLARSRPDPVLLFDADTTFGSLALRTGAPQAAGVHELAGAGDPGTFDVLAAALGRSPDGVFVLPSGRDPGQSAALDENTYVAAMNAVYRHFPVMVTDCGAGVATPLMRRVVSGCHTLVLATSPSIDGLLATHNVLRWLAGRGSADLARRSVVALTDVPREGAVVDLAEARRRFAGLVADVVTVPSDRVLAVGGPVRLDDLAPPTRAAAVRLAAGVLSTALTAP
jgi:MinD-like ATPase involved in chromosome partitioning or flagellar assembly